MSKYRRSGSEESSNSSSESETEDKPGALSISDDAPVSPLALMDEKSPEAWLGNFLTIIGAPPAVQFNTIAAARHDDRLRAHLTQALEDASKDEPLRLLEPGYADQLKAKDWAAWWRRQESLARYCYSALSLLMLNDRSHTADLVVMYGQDANSRIQKDANYVLCYLLGKEWPVYRVTEADFVRLSAPGE